MTTETIPISFRPASPTIADGLLFARYLDQAQGRMYRMMLGLASERIVAAAFVQPGHDLSYEHVTFAEGSETTIGMVSAYSAESRHKFGNILAEVAGWHRYRLSLLLRINRRLFDFMDEIADGDFYIRALAVDKDKRGHRVGTRLIQRAEDSALAAGANRLALDVAAKNHKAQRLYARCGLAAEAASPRWFRLPNTNVIRMVKRLH